MTSMGAMSFDADLVAKDNTVAKILEMKDDVSSVVYSVASRD